MPDLNSVPPSPHFLVSTSRQASQQQMTAVPPAPGSPSLNILPSNQQVVNNPTSSVALPSPQFPSISHIPGSAMGDNTGVGQGPGPQRLPRPVTASDIHSQLEKEQEAVVNRLTRELAILRAAHNASVVSTTSSTSASAVDPIQPLESSRGRHQRTASSTSIRSNIGSVSTASLAPGISSPLPIRISPGTGLPATLADVARQRRASTASRRSRTGSPAPFEPSSYFSSAPRASQPGSVSNVPTPGVDTDASPGVIPSTARVEEARYYREQLEMAKAENESLKQRLRELENMIRGRRESDASTAAAGASVGGGGSRSAGRARSDSVSTTASVAASVATSATGAGGISVAAQRDRPRIVSQISSPSMIGVGVPEEEVRVGESASSSGLQR
ncbi:hypothetical protein QBC42DRAFT_186911 [Cladorrhinum samala]|uniref:Uncharacterized protein n=1 Tax=Cladorrhinum samala TaxID=585594 RepID=A0AAV9HBQ2_9PEZI|nr:hypothetical protein QBC42DRAFT_186911 [Cladorrhinum samala]